MSRVVHFEIHAENPDRAIAFYTAVFQWQFSSWEGGQFEYWMINTGPDSEPGINGGLIRRRGEIDGQAVIAYVCTVNVESLAATEALVARHGGSIVVPKMRIPGVGWLSYAKDTEGNIFGLLEPEPMGK